MCLYFIISHTSVVFLNDFHINCLKKSQNNCITTQREIMSLTELIKVENVNKHLFPKLNKNDISMFLYCKNVN
jgi:hypothetical protein